MSKAAVRVRGDKGMKKELLSTVRSLGLERPNYCVILEETPNMMGMLRRARSYITWGDIDDQTRNMLTEKHKEKKVFRLNPPKKGYGRKGIKKAFSVGGALGDRKEKINDLIQRMM